MPDASDAWKELAQNGWAALHNIREVLTQLAPPGSLPAEEAFTYGPEHVHEAAVLIDAIHALHARAVNAEQAAAELVKLIREIAPLIHSAGVPSAPDAFSDEPEAMTEVLTPDAEVLEARRLDAKVRAYLEATAGEAHV
jgi:hypothetical protein